MKRETTMEKGNGISQFDSKETQRYYKSSNIENVMLTIILDGM